MAIYHNPLTSTSSDRQTETIHMIEEGNYGGQSSSSSVTVTENNRT
jgi:hypothetical protein